MKCQCCVGVISSMLCHAERSFFCHSERREESSMDTSLRLRSVQHDRVGHCEHFFRVIPSGSEESTHGCFTTLTLRSA